MTAGQDLISTTESTMSPNFPPVKPDAAVATWRVDPSVLTWRYGHDLVAFHLRTGRSYRLPGLLTWLRDFLERGGELNMDDVLDVAGGVDGVEITQQEVYGALQTLEREKLIWRASEWGQVAAEGESKKLFLIVPSDKAGPRELGYGGTSALSATTVLQRVRKLVIELSNGHTYVSVGESPAEAERQRKVVKGGIHALRLVDAFEHPRTIYEVVRVLQGRVREAHGWIEMIEALVRLFEGGVLRDVEQEQR